jgi:hypothetical protein
MIVSVIGSQNVEKLAKILGKNKKEINEMISEVAKIIAESGNEIIAVPEGLQGFFMKKYKEFGGKKAIGVVPKEDKQWGHEWLEHHLCDETLNAKTWFEQPFFMMTDCDIVVMMGFGLCTIGELSFLKFPWSRKKPKPKVLVVKEFLRGKLPEELSYDLKDYIEYVSLKELKKKLK